MRLAIIDGTGVYNDHDYAVAMRHSFCHQMHLSMHIASRYERGPSNEGYRVEERGERASKYLLEAHRRSPRSHLMLAGYSRGASAAIMAAEMLQREGVKIHAMFLFDPVARHLSKGGEEIPANVLNVWTARRSLSPAMVAHYDNTIDLIGNPMRPWFGGTGFVYHGSALHHHHRKFDGSHGALGGVGWTHVAEDAVCQRHVASWMNGAFEKLKLPIRLHAFAPSSKA